MKTKQTPENTKHINIKLPIEMHDKIETQAEESHRNLSQQLRFIIEEYYKFKENK